MGDILLIAKPPIEGAEADCYECNTYNMTKTSGYRDDKDLWFCNDCGATRWITADEIKQQREREQFWLKQRYGIVHPRSIRNYWRRGGAS